MLRLFRSSISYLPAALYALPSLLLLILLLLTGRSLCGQSIPIKTEKSDSVLIAAMEDAFFFSEENPDSALKLSVQTLKLAKDNKKLRALALKAKGWAYMHLGNYDSSFTNLTESAGIFKALQDTLNLVFMYLNLAIVYSNYSQFETSLKYALLADSLAGGINDPKVQGTIKKQMGILYREQDQDQKAMALFKESLAAFRAAKDSYNYLSTAVSLSILYRKLAMPESSLAVLKTCIPMAGHPGEKNYNNAILNEHLGNSYFSMGRYDKALDRYMQSYQSYVFINSKNDIAYADINIGQTYARQKKYPEAESYLLQGYHLSDSLKMTSYASDAASQLANLYAEGDSWQQAYKWLATYSDLRDTLRNIEQSGKVAELQTRYETEKKDNEIALLKKNKQLNDIKLQKQKTFQYAVAIILLLLALISMLAINRYRAAQRAKRKAEIEQVRNNIARNLHDDIGSTLTSINILSKMALQQAGGGSEALGNLQKIKERSSAIMDSMNDIVWAVNPANDTLDKIILRMKEFGAEITEQAGIRFSFSEPDGSEYTRLSLEQRNNLYLVYKEALNNAVKYSQADQVDVLIRQDSKTLHLQIRDNGRGFDAQRQHSGNGLKNMRTRTADMQAFLQITSAPGNGTVIAIDIPIP